jgi:uncharacterized protein YecE (DUF72 family)
VSVWIGTSGFSYPEWIGPFYPKGTGAGAMLPYYARQFPLIELNYTYYRLPTAAQLTRLAAHTPDRFQFLVKLPSTLTHERDPKDLPLFRKAVEPLHDRGQLLGLLGQFPQSWHHGKQEKTWLNTLADVFGDLSLAVEFRHRSWFRDDIPPWLRERRLDLVSVDVPDLPGLYPRGLVQSGDRVYIRFHSRNSENWYRSGAERYDYYYSDDEMGEWIEALERLPSIAMLLLLFNNCRDANAVRNAQRLREMLLSRLPHRVVPPPVEAQRSLFD